MSWGAFNFYAYAVALIGNLVVTQIVWRRDAVVCALAIALNWLLCVAFTVNTGDAIQPLALAALDFTTACMVIAATYERKPMAVVGVYLFQCVMHLAASTDAWFQHGPYLWALGIGAWAQALFVSWWCVQIATSSRATRRLKNDHKHPLLFVGERA